MNRIGCSTLAFGQFDLETALGAIAEIGFRVIDLAVLEGSAVHYDPQDKSHSDYAELKKKVQSYGLSVATLNVNAGALNGEDQEAQTAKLESAIECAEVLGCCAVTTKVGDKVTEDLWELSARESISRIRYLADRAHDARRKLSLEIPHTGTLCETLEQCVHFFEEVNHPSVDVTLDSSHVHANGLDVRELTRQFVGKLGHAHLRDVKGEETHVPPGEGEIDFGFFHQMMRLAGFHRDYTIELKFPEGASLEEIKATLARAREHVQPLIRPVRIKRPAS